MRHLALLLALALVAACSSTDPPTRCTPGASVACTCPGGGTGAQVCSADGASYGSCVCGTDAGGVDAATAGDAVAVDAPTSTDVAVPDVPGCESRDGGAWITCAETTLGPGGCTDLNTSTGHCGACGRACANGATCTAGRCSELADASVPSDPRCPSSGRPTACVTGGQIGCWDLATSNSLMPAQNCGACGRSCPRGCERGECL